MIFDPGEIFGSSTPPLFSGSLPDPLPSYPLPHFSSVESSALLPAGSLLGQIPIYTKSKIFVSYHHRRDQEHYDTFSRCVCDEYHVLYDNSPERAKDSDYAEYIMRSLRENHIFGTSCTIVLCGLETRWRKFVDWEIDATLSMEHGLIGVLLPTNPIYLYPNGPNLPDRLQDNIASGYALFTTWQEIAQNGPHFVREKVAVANSRCKRLIKNDRPRMLRNGTPPWLQKSRSPRLF